jgi:hypothetical protein
MISLIHAMLNLVLSEETKLEVKVCIICFLYYEKHTLSSSIIEPMGQIHLVNVEIIFILGDTSSFPIQ